MIHEYMILQVSNNIIKQIHGYTVEHAKMHFNIIDKPKDRSSECRIYIND